MLMRVKTSQSKRAKLLKQIQAASTVDELKSAMIYLLTKPAMGNNSPEGIKRGRV